MNHYRHYHRSYWYYLLLLKVVCSGTAWRLPDLSDDDSSFQPAYDNEEEAIVRAMERSFRGRTYSSAEFLAEGSSCSSSMEDGPFTNSFYDCDDMSSSPFSEDNMDDDDGERPIIHNTPPKSSRQNSINQPRRTQNLAIPRRSSLPHATADRRPPAQSQSPQRSVNSGDANYPNENDDPLKVNLRGLRLIPIPKGYSFELSTSDATATLAKSPVVLASRRSSPSSTKPTVSQKRKTNTSLTTRTISPWVRRFLTKCQKDVLLPVPRDFIVDNFNLILLPEILSLDSTTFRKAWRLLVSTKDYDEAYSSSKESDTTIETAATNLYLQLHQRFLLSHRGMDMVRRRLQTSPIFGRCPAPACRGTPLLPIGQDDGEAQRYCASCRNVWMHWDTMVPGWAWGDSFCHLFVLEHGAEVLLGSSSKVGTGTTASAVPQIFGFQLHPSAKYG